MPHRVAIKDLKEMMKERTFVSVVMLILFVASFSSVLTYGLLILYNPTALGVTPSVRVAVVGSCEIRGECMSMNDAVGAFNTGRVDAIAIFEKIGNKTYVKIVLPQDEVKAVQALLYLKKELVGYEKRLRNERGIPNFHVDVYSDGRKVRIPDGASMVFRFVYLILIPLLAMTTAVIAAGMTIDSICEELERGTIDLLLTSPLSDRVISVGKVLAPLILSTLLIPVWLLLLVVNRVEIYNFPVVFLQSLSLSALFISIAYLISVQFRDRERSQLVFSLIAASSLPAMISLRISPAVMAGRIASGIDSNPLAIIAPFLLTLLPFAIAGMVTIRRD